MKRTASAHWHGDLKSGNGALSTQSNVLNKTPYSFMTRFENSPGTNPEELIAAAHAGCFTMAFSAALGKAGCEPKDLYTQATLSFELENGIWTVKSIHLSVKGQVPEIDQAKFQTIAEDAKTNCPISRLLKAEITLSAELES